MNPNRESVDALIDEAVRRRTAHMRWRPRYEAWVRKRIWQEEVDTPIVWNIEHFVGRPEGKTILEIGSGMGGQLVRLQRDGLNVVGIDLNQANCEITRYRGMRFGLSARVVRAVGEQLPLQTESIDIVLCYEVLEHVRDPSSVLAEIRRVLRPGGAAFVTAPNRYSLYDQHYHLWGINLMPRGLADRMVSWLGRAKNDRSAGMQKLTEMHYYTWSAFNRRCLAAGFRVLDVTERKLLANEGFTLGRGRKRFLDALRRLGILGVVYRLVRSSFLASYHVLLRPTD